MYLSRIALNKERRETCKALSIPQIMHAAVQSSFPPCEEEKEAQVRTLWRVDKFETNTWLYVLSQQLPDFHHIIDQFGWPCSGQTWETKEYQKLLVQLEKGQQWHFRLQANPIKTIERKRIPHVTVAQQKEWLKTRADKNGFSIAKTFAAGETEDALEVIHRDTISFKKRPQDRTRITFAVATFEGILVVDDPELLSHALCFGIGKEKSYGCGLLTLAKM